MKAQVSTAQIKAVVVGDIPAHRLLWLLALATRK